MILNKKGLFYEENFNITIFDDVFYNADFCHL